MTNSKKPKTEENNGWNEYLNESMELSFLKFCYSNESKESRKCLLDDIKNKKGVYWLNSDDLDKFIFEFLKKFILVSDHERIVSSLIAEDAEWLEKTLPNYIKKSDVKKVLDEFEKEFKTDEIDIDSNEKIAIDLCNETWNELRRRLKV